MIRPTLRAALLFGAGVPLSAAAVIADGSLWPVALVFVAAALLALGADALLAMPQGGLALSADLPPMLYVGAKDRLAVTLVNHSSRPAVALQGRCDVDDMLRDPGSLDALLRGRERVVLEFPLVPNRRGMATVERLWLRWSGPLGLMTRQRLESKPLRLPVVPNIKAVRAAAARFASPDALFGMKRQNLMGDGSEFDAMRDYLPGLDHRAIAWKHSARHRKLVCKEFRAERNHPIVLAFDTGYLMREPIDGSPKLDHAINAGLLLGFMSLKAGDQVGMFGFDSAVRLYAPPAGGTQCFARLQRQTADLAYSSEETNFTLGLTDLQGRLNRRSLIVLLTDFVDTVTADLMVDNLARLANRHLVVFVTLQDPHIAAAIDAPPAGVADIARSVVAGNFLHDRSVVFERLKRHGVLCLDVAAAKVSMELLNRYIEIKRREMI